MRDAARRLAAAGQLARLVMGRPYFIRLRCAEPDCGETGFYEADTRAEEREIRVRLRERPWRCVRHTRPGEVLSSSEPVKSHRLVVREERHGKFWREETAERGGSGFVYGPGFKAFAHDFPSGTLDSGGDGEPIPA